MAKDKIIDLRHHLFSQLERLNDDEDMQNPIKRQAEIERAKAMADISQVIINSAKLEVHALKVLAQIPANSNKKITFLGDAEK